MASCFRIVEDYGTGMLVSADGLQVFKAELCGNLVKKSGIEKPTVGDWVSGDFQPGDWIYPKSADKDMSDMMKYLSGKGLPH